MLTDASNDQFGRVPLVGTRIDDKKTRTAGAEGAPQRAPIVRATDPRKPLALDEDIAAMRNAAIVVCLCLVLAGCAGSPGTSPTSASEPATEAATTSTASSLTTEPTLWGAQFNGEANAHVVVPNPTSETLRATVRIDRNDTVALNETRRVPPNDQWTVAVIERPGNYAVTITIRNWTDSASVQLPRAEGDRRTYIAVKQDATDGEFRLRVYSQV